MLLSLLIFNMNWQRYRSIESSRHSWDNDNRVIVVWGHFESILRNWVMSINISLSNQNKHCPLQESKLFIDHLLKLSTIFLLNLCNNNITPAEWEVPWLKGKVTLSYTTTFFYAIPQVLDRYLKSVSACMCLHVLKG